MSLMSSTRILSGLSSLDHLHWLWSLSSVAFLGISSSLAVENVGAGGLAAPAHP